MIRRPLAMVCLVLILSFVYSWAAFANGEIVLEGPSEILPREVVAVQGSGVGPNETVLLTLEVNWHFTSELMDFGDAPDSGYPTMMDSNGARHFIRNDLFLGEKVDPEPYGQPSPGASCDDFDCSDDEDGVRFLTPLKPGEEAEIEVDASKAGYLNAWIDVNGNQNWSDPDEQIFAGLALNPGKNVLNFLIPNGSPSIATFARFRFSSQQDLPFYGQAPDGEVEDYQIAIGSAEVPKNEGGCNATALIPIWGARHCVQSRDVMRTKIIPACYGIAAWQHDPDLEEECGHLEVHYRNPYYYWFNGTNCEAEQSRIFHSEMHCECWKVVFAAKLCNGSTFNVTNTAKRIVVADKNGEFSSSVRVPITKLMGGEHILLASSANKTGKLNLNVNISSIENEPPLAFIYARDLFVKNWKIGIGEVITLDGRSLSIANLGNIASYLWDLGDGTTSTEPIVSHSYAVPGEKIVTLTVQDDKGISDTMEVYILVE
ncbi:MAG: PKD domain-containing protein [Methanotrichaceae archaeon]|nr:PKD domain-containing protein [Methanotrichaceae archaeon]